MDRISFCDVGSNHNGLDSSEHRSGLAKQVLVKNSHAGPLSSTHRPAINSLLPRDPTLFEFNPLKNESIRLNWLNHLESHECILQGLRISSPFGISDQTLQSPMHQEPVAISDVLILALIQIK